MNPDIHFFDAQGRPVWGFGGPASFRTTTFRGYDVFLEWLIEPSKTQPCLIVQPTRKAAEHGAFCICLGAVGLYLDASGNLTPEAKGLCERAMTILGKPKLDMEVRNLMAVLHRWLPELILMPPVPTAARREESRRPLIEVELSDQNTGKVHAEVSV